MKKKLLRFEASLLTALIICCCLNITAFSGQCDEIRSKMLRMHVIANSDSESDQNLKLKVRNAVLEAGKEVFDGSVTASDAKERIIPQIDKLESAALDVIESEGYSYDVKITVSDEYFPTRTYDNSVTLPAGVYTAVQVVIGGGRGHNWWCVMLPPMCLPAADAECGIDDVLTEEESRIVKGGDKYKIKFKIVEIYEDIFKREK